MAGGGVADAGREGAPRSSDASRPGSEGVADWEDPDSHAAGSPGHLRAELHQRPLRTQCSFWPRRLPHEVHRELSGRRQGASRRAPTARHAAPRPAAALSVFAARGSAPPHASIDTACAPGVESLASCSSRAGRIPQDERSALAPGRPHSPPEAPRAPQAPLMRPIPSSGGRLLHRFGHALRRRRSRSSGEGREAEPFAVPLDRAGREPTVDERFRVRARTMDRRHSIRLLGEGRERGGARAASGSGRRPTERGWPPLRSGWPRWSGRGCSW